MPGMGFLFTSRAIHKISPQFSITIQAKLVSNNKGCQPRCAFITNCNRKCYYQTLMSRVLKNLEDKLSRVDCQGAKRVFRLGAEYNSGCT